MDDLALIEEGHGGEPDVRVRAHVDPVTGAELGRPEMVEEDERTDHPPVDVRQRATNREMPKIDAARHDDEVDGVGGGRVARHRVLVGREAHLLLLDGVLHHAAALGAARQAFHHSQSSVIITDLIFE